MSKKVSIIIECIAAIWVYGILLLFLYVLFLYNRVDLGLNTRIYYPNLASKQVFARQFQQQLVFLESDPIGKKFDGARVFYLDGWIFRWLLFPGEIFYKLVNGNEFYIGAVTVPGSVILIDSSNSVNKVSAYSAMANFSHELVHVVQHQNYGFIFSSFIMPNWINEGYPTYRMSLYIKKPIDKLQVTKDFKLYAKLVKHAIEKMAITPDQLHRGKVSYTEVMYSLCQVEALERC